jgi:hypothetical protein
MKISALLVLGLFSTNALAIEFITEQEVQKALGVEKVIEIGKEAAEKLLVGENTICHGIILSRSSRAYIVKKNNTVKLILTPSGLAQLTDCGDL